MLAWCVHTCPWGLWQGLFIYPGVDQNVQLCLCHTTGFHLLSSNLLFAHIKRNKETKINHEHYQTVMICRLISVPACLEWNSLPQMHGYISEGRGSHFGIWVLLGNP